MNLLGKLVLGLLTIALPLGEIVRVTSNEIAITLMDLGVGLVVLYWLFIKKNFSAWLSKPIFIFIGILLFSLIVNANRLSSEEILISFLYLLRWIFYALLYFVVLSLSSVKPRIERGMIIGGTILVFLGFIQYFLYPDLRNLRYAGWDEHLYRMFSSFLDPNFAGIFFVLFFLFVIDKLFTKQTLMLKIISALTLIAIVLTFSRSAYLALILGLMTLLFLKGKKLAGLGIVVLFFVLTSIFVLVSSKSEGTNLLRVASGEARLDSMRNAITIFKDNPIFGVGFNGYRYAQRDYGFVDESRMLVHSATGTDNSFLFVLATSGVVGFAVFLYLLFKISSFPIPLIKASVFALIVNSLFINSLFYPPIMLWFWILLGTLPAGRQVKGNN